MSPSKIKGDFINKQSAVLDTLLPLMSNNKLVKEVLSKGAVIYLLDLFCYSSNSYVREKSAELLSKMSNDKLVGPKVRILFSKFLPLLFLDAMSDSPEAAVNLFDGQQENPELIWNNTSRESVSKVVRKMAIDLFNEQHTNPSAQFKLDDEFKVVNHELSKEITVSGVYLRLFVQNPSWVLRRPKEFLTDLMDNFQTLLTKKEPDENKINLITQSIICLLQTQPTLLELIPPMGYILGIVKFLSNKKEPLIVKCCFQIINQLSNSRSCIDTMMQTSNVIEHFIDAIKMDNSLVGIACGALNRMLLANTDQLVEQALATDLIKLLLKILDSNQTQSTTSTIKAQIVQVLKRMCQSELHGAQVSAILEDSTIWKEFKDQKHDLFITQNSNPGYITGGSVNIAGYLTQGSNQFQASTQPPPID